MLSVLVLRSVLYRWTLVFTSRAEAEGQKEKHVTVPEATDPGCLVTCMFMIELHVILNRSKVVSEGHSRIEEQHVM